MYIQLFCATFAAVILARVCASEALALNCLYQVAVVIHL